MTAGECPGSLKIPAAWSKGKYRCGRCGQALCALIEIDGHVGVDLWTPVGAAGWRIENGVWELTRYSQDHRNRARKQLSTNHELLPGDRKEISARLKAPNLFRRGTPLTTTPSIDNLNQITSVFELMKPPPPGLAQALFHKTGGYQFPVRVRCPRCRGRTINVIEAPSLAR